jgi:hypothetical protein
MLEKIARHKWNILALVAIWLLFECWISWAAFCEYQKQYAATYQPAEEYGCIFRGPVISLGRSFYGWWGHVFDKPDAYIALFTAILAVSTIALWWSTRRLWAVTKIAADHIPIVERAYVFVTPVPSIENDRTIIHLKIENFGQTPAIITEGYGASSPDDRVGPPVYPSWPENPRFLDAVISKDQPGIEPRLFPNYWWSPIITPHYFFGYLKYIDIFRKKHTIRFCVKLFPAEGTIDVAGSPAWNEWD